MCNRIFTKVHFSEMFKHGELLKRVNIFDLIADTKNLGESGYAGKPGEAVVAKSK